MASQTAQTTNQTQPAPRKTTTIGARLTRTEIAALDALIAEQPYVASRAGMVASIVIGVLQQDGFLPEDYDAD